MGPYANVTRLTGGGVPRTGFCPTDQQLDELLSLTQARDADVRRVAVKNWNTHASQLAAGTHRNARTNPGCDRYGDATSGFARRASNANACTDTDTDRE
jgi:hypothetical protein